jgi:hypothetical protein
MRISIMVLAEVTKKGRKARDNALPVERRSEHRAGVPIEDSAGESTWIFITPP